MTVPRFWRKIKNRYNLEGTRCSKCGNTYFPPRNLCPTCRRDGDLEKYKFSGEGKLITYTVIRAAADSHEKETPYAIGIIELEEGTSFTSQIVNCEIDEIEIGMELEPAFRKISQESEEGLIYYGIKYQPKKEESQKRS